MKTVSRSGEAPGHLVARGTTTGDPNATELSGVQASRREGLVCGPVNTDADVWHDECSGLGDLELRRTAYSRYCRGDASAASLDDRLRRPGVLTRLTTQVVLMGAVALLVAACGSSGSTKSSSPTATASASTSSAGASTASSPPAPASTAKASTITIGDTCDCSGLGAASNGGWYQGLSVWADWINTHGGILGHRVQIANEDTKTDPVTTLTDTQTLLANKKVVALVLGSTVTNLTKAIDSAGAPVVGGLVSAPLFGSDKYVFPGATGFGDLFNLMAATAAKGQTNKKVAILYCAESATCAAGLPALTAGVKAVGGKVVYRASISASASSYGAVFGRPICGRWHHRDD